MGLYERCQRHIPLSAVSTLGIGGPARWFFRANTCEDLQSALSFAEKEQIPFLVVGKGSNCLFPDDGFSGLVIHNRVESVLDVGGGRFVVSSGYSFPSLGVKTAQEGWGGLEFAAGIPGTVGGAVFMNAASHKQETGDTVVWAEYVDTSGALVRLTHEELSFEYRRSIFQSNQGVYSNTPKNRNFAEAESRVISESKMGHSAMEKIDSSARLWIITSVCFQLKRDEGAVARQREMVEYRKKTQPYKDRSAGCVFRNPPGASAGSLIEEVGLKGKKIGGAQVSPVHANFIVNKEGATARDVMCLMHHVREVVSERKGVWLESEIRIIPSTVS